MRPLRIVFTLIIISSLIAFTGCAQSDTTDSDSENTSEGSQLSLSLEELAQYDGLDGNPAYIAVDGIIYDVSEVSQWAGGKHNGFTAGNDLTEEIKTVSPHGISVLSTLPKVGTLKE